MIQIIIAILLIVLASTTKFWLKPVVEDCMKQPEKGMYENQSDYNSRLANSKEQTEKYYKMGRSALWAISILISLILVATQTIRIVSTGLVGVKTSFGVVSGRASEGFNLILPWEEITPMNIKIQKQSFTNLSASTKDAQSISNISIDVNYKLNPDKAEEIFSTVGENYQETLISPLLTQNIKDRLALYNAESLVTERNSIVDGITAQLQENLKDYGIDVVAVSLVNYDFSPDFNSALERKAVASKEIETAKNNQEKAKVEAETNRIKTEQLTDAVLMEKLIDAIRNGTGTYIIDTSNLSISVK